MVTKIGAKGKGDVMTMFIFSQAGAGMNVARFAALMRRLAEDNNGSFVGLNSLR